MPKLLGFRNLCSTILTYHFLELFSKVYICLSTMIVLFNSHSCFFLHIVTMLRVLETWTLTIIRELNVSNSAYQSPVIALKYIDNSRCLYCALASGNSYFVLIKVSLFWPNSLFLCRYRTWLGIKTKAAKRRWKNGSGRQRKSDDWHWCKTREEEEPVKVNTFFY